MSQDAMDPCTCIECARIVEEGHIPAAAHEAASIGLSLEEAVNRFKRAMIEACGKAPDGSVRRIHELADRLGISRKTLWELRRKLGLSH